MLSEAKVKLGLVAVPAILGLALLASGCNTTRGMGEDISAAGHGMSSAAESTEEKIEDKMSDESDDEEMKKETTSSGTN